MSPSIDEQLLERIDRANASLDALRKELRDKIRRRDFLTGCAIFAALVGLCLGGYGIKVQRDAHHETKAARRAACVQYNRQQDDAIAGSAAHDIVLAEILVPEPRTPAQTEDVRDALQQLHDADLQAHRKRDCSDAGIAAFLSNDPAPGTTTSTTTSTTVKEP